MFLKLPDDQTSDIKIMAQNTLWGQIYMKSIKFMFSKKATKIDEIFTVDLTLTT